MSLKIPFLVVGLTGPIGAGCTSLANCIKRVHPKEQVQDKKMYDEVIKKMKDVTEEIRSAEKQDDRIQLHKKLEDLYKQRIILDVILNTEHPKFIHIRMSALIAKKAVQYIDQADEWKNKNPEEAAILRDLRTRFADTIELLDREDIKFEDLGKDALDQIDRLLSELDSASDKIKAIELKRFFEGDIDCLHLQTFGDNVRSSGNPFWEGNGFSNQSSENFSILAKEANRIIKYYRNRQDDKAASCFVIDAFRNPSEIEFFRRRYEQFYLVSISASESVRRERLRRILESKEIDTSRFPELFEKIGKRDWGSDVEVVELHRQNVSKCFYLSDIAIDNNCDYEKFSDELFMRFLKYYALIISPGCIQPTREETYMNLAYSLSLRSSCISRKVGAVITDKAGFIVGLGWNEAAHDQIGCGLRQKQDVVQHIDGLFSMDLLRGIINADDLRHIEDTDSFCFKDILSERKTREKLQKIKLSPEEDEDRALRILNDKKLEYCRALHAEENALLQVASRGGMGVDGGEIYTTTFPCELCAKKLYQAGIQKIYYTEPYPKSISESVFLKDGVRRIEAKQFEGVKSYSYFRLYKPLYDKKEAQRLD